MLVKKYKKYQLIVSDGGGINTHYCEVKLQNGELILRTMIEAKTEKDALVELKQQLKSLQIETYREYTLKVYEIWTSAVLGNVGGYHYCIGMYYPTGRTVFEESLWADSKKEAMDVLRKRADYMIDVMRLPKEYKPPGKPLHFYV